MKTKFENLKTALKKLDIEYRSLNDTEIVIPAVCVQENGKELKEITSFNNYDNNIENLTTISDEAIIHIYKDSYGYCSIGITLDEQY